MTNSSELKGIHKIPNEILTKILAFVPYVPRGDGTSSHLTASAGESHGGEEPIKVSPGSHTSLGQVSTRFRDIIRSPALRREIVKYQFPEIAIFRDSTQIAPADLASISVLHSGILKSIDKILRNDDCRKAREATTMGVFMLEKMASFGITTDDMRSNACLIAMARKDLWSTKWLMALRYAIRRICDHLFPTTADVHSLLRQHGGSLPETPEALATLTEMFKRRSFEKALLLNNQRQFVSRMIIDDGPCERTSLDFLLQYLRFIGYMRLWVPGGKESLDLAEQQEYNEAVKDLTGNQWRLLTCTGFEQHNGIQHHSDCGIWKAWSAELTLDELARASFEDAKVDIDWIPTMRDLQEARLFLSESYSRMKESGIPASIRAFVEEEDLLDMTSLEG